MMKISRPAAGLLAALLLLAAAAGFRLLDATPPATKAALQADDLPPTRPANTAADTAGAAIAELQQRIARLDAEMSELRRRLPASGVSLAAQAAAVDASVPASRTPARRDAPPPAAEMEAADRALADTRESTFRNEMLDARWSVATAAKLQQALSAGAAAGAAAPSVRSLECRSRTCRVEIGAQDASQLDAFMPAFANRVASTLASIAASHVDAADGTPSLVLYLSR